MRFLQPTANRRFNELIGLLILVLATLLGLALVSYSPRDRSLDTAAALARPHNWVGPAGAYSADLLFQIFGIAAFLLVLGLAATAMQWFRAPRPQAPRYHGLAGLLLCVLFVGALFSELPHVLLWRGTVPWSGTAGRLVAQVLTALFNPVGAWILTATGIVAGLFLATDFSLLDLHDWATEAVYPKVLPVFRPLLIPVEKWKAWRERQHQAKLERRERRALARARQKEQKAAEAAEKEARRRSRLAERRRRRELEEEGEEAGYVEELDEGEAEAREDDREEEYDDTPVVMTPPERAIEPGRGAGPQAPGRAAAGVSAAMAAQAAPRSAPVPVAPPAAASNRAAAGAGRPLSAPEPGSRVVAPTPSPSPSIAGYQIPPTSVLQEAGPGNAVNEAELRQLAGLLRAKCDEFGVRGQVTQINPGPVVTTYEFKPEAGVKYSRITSLNEDLCLALAAESVYIERIPGKSTVGIEVPNPHRETIYLREIVESDAFRRSRSPLSMALGKDVNGEIVVADLSTMPHLLIAGSTGSGKSVALNSMITSLVFKATPDEVRFILVDPKRLELGLYSGIPHLYTPIITEPKLAANALRNAVREMERRLKLLATCGVRNIAQYNRQVMGTQQGLFDNLRETEENRPLPYIVIVIDELADLMIVDSANVEESITRLAQMARAVGIHLILATQRPSVDVITGLIKANFPARMSFRVATKIDSRTILDSQGAESLLGKGDMLFLPPGTSRFQRVHGAFITEPEIGRVVQFWSQQEQPEMDTSFLKAPAEEGEAPETGESGDDPLFEDAVRIVLEQRKASTSLLQRRLRIGYGRAAHLIDLMYADGIVGPADGPRPREVLKSPDWLSEIDQAARY